MKQVDVNPNDINKLKDIKKIPVLTKKTLKSNYDKILPKNVNLEDCWRPLTSGSTGIPLKMVFDKKAENFTNAVLLRANFSVGQKFRDKWVSILNKKREKTWFQKFGILYPRRVFSLQPEILFNHISRIQPKIISGYASSIFLLARYIQKHNRFNIIRPKLIFSGGEFLQPNMRKFINETFEIEVFDQYGCAELGRTAWECEKHKGYHIDSEAVLVEILGNDYRPLNNGELGQIAFTGLYNYSFPLIRYLVGDIAAIDEEQCSCGRGLKLLKVIGGRSDDFIINDINEIYSFRVLASILRAFIEILQYKAIQEEPELIVLEIIPNNFWNDKSSDKIRSAIQNILGKGVDIEIDQVSDIQQEKSGKTLSFVSKIDLNIFK
jgi:phenylacetate-CoA ligase